MAQTRTVAPASGMPRELKTMSSLRVPCACVGATAPGQTCRASATSAQKNVIVVARLKPDWAGRCDAIFDRIIFQFTVSMQTHTKWPAVGQARGKQNENLCPVYLFDLAIGRRRGSIKLHYEIVKEAASPEQARDRQLGRKSRHSLK
jgi:hypothetical protein